MVVVNAGAPVLLPWADEVAAVLLAWFPGQEFGNALADVLLGRVGAGRPAADDVAARARTGCRRRSPSTACWRYDEGLFVGYRGDRSRPRFAFGHGLGYTTWEYVAIEAPPRSPPGADVRSRSALRNTGARRGREVVQLYASCPDSAVERPARWLVGFAAVEAEPGEEVTATVRRGAARVRALGRPARRLARRARHVRARRRAVVADLPLCARQITVG